VNVLNQAAFSSRALTAYALTILFVDVDLNKLPLKAGGRPTLRDGGRADSLYQCPRWLTGGCVACGGQTMPGGFVVSIFGVFVKIFVFDLHSNLLSAQGRVVGGREAHSRARAGTHIDFLKVILQSLKKSKNQNCAY
jgi:hypothetical protein